MFEACTKCPQVLGANRVLNEDFPKEANYENKYSVFSYSPD